MLHSESWSSCAALLSPEPYIEACVQDMCGCTNSTDDFCVCSTLSEYSRQCSHAGGQPPNWRTSQFCGNLCFICTYNIIHISKHKYTIPHVLLFNLIAPLPHKVEFFPLLQLSSAHTTWCMRRAVPLAWRPVHFQTPIHCVRTTIWMAASALLVGHAHMYTSLTV